MVFIDGGHSEEAAKNDYNLWSKRLNLGGLLAIHDVFPNPEDGGRPPYNIYLKALESGNFQEIALIKSLSLLKKINSIRLSESLSLNLYPQKQQNPFLKI